MKRPRHAALVDKATDAAIAAIEIYNKPDFRYREEAFSILMFNAWELLLKARVLKENQNNERSIQVLEPSKKKDGTDGKRMKFKLNRCGEPMTIDAMRAAALVREYATDPIDDACIDNLNLLAEVRDNAIHLATIGPGLGKRIQEVGSASLRNFVRAAERWFKRDLTRYNFYLMPLAFHGPGETVVSLLAEKRPAARKLLDYIEQTEKRHVAQAAGGFNVTLQIELKFLRTAHPEAIPVRQAPDGIPVTLTEANVRDRWPWTYDKLAEKLRDRYANFSQNARYHGIRAKLEKDERYCHVRLLDPDNPKSGSKRFYSPNIVSEFDKHYTLR
jgi:hypothetical protein